MIIVGAKGFAKELLQIISVDMGLADHQIVFFDNVSEGLTEKLFNRFVILKSFKQVETYLNSSNDKQFVLGLGQPKHRDTLYQQFVNLGCHPVNVFSKHCDVGSFDVKIGLGTTVLSGAIISNSVSIGIGCLIYYNSIITHDCEVGNFVEVSPGAKILGRTKIGHHTSLGAGCIILPDVTIGNYVIIGAGTVVTKDIPDNCTVVGVPGKIIKQY
ncbi:NeuD/PglB/VioB family sugar acetyltransferase [Mesoflavibacter zeaxanthinifaciens]|uniref:NeuD/PglB/VioB family sugar acetyltransferase n=1 Tax=Mesoflavibacter zeaxanthinifaciens TaxID=393060 RepID=UPI000416775D|nr:NeuD/PglB/VioB family sugar acetyltransferase [Mesoflavibacter zeaxanthinifaciens]